MGFDEAVWGLVGSIWTLLLYPSTVLQRTQTSCTFRFALFAFMYSIFSRALPAEFFDWDVLSWWNVKRQSYGRSGYHFEPSFFSTIAREQFSILCDNACKTKNWGISAHFSAVIVPCSVSFFLLSLSCRDFGLIEISRQWYRCLCIFLIREKHNLRLLRWFLQLAFRLS